MKNLINKFLILIATVACGKLEYSPYAFNVDSLKVSDNNLRSILSKGQFEAAAKTHNYSIAIISDTHDYYDGLEKQISYINSNYENYDFVIVTGDITNVGLASEFQQTKKRLDKLKVPYITTSGNHDLLIDGEKIYNELFGKDTYAFVYKDTKYILYNNNNWESSAQSPDFTWLEKELKSNQSSNLIVLSHVAPNDTDRFNKSDINFTRDLINKHGVDYYINGHNHNHAEGLFGDANHLTAGSPSKKILLTVNISITGVTHEFVKL